MSILQIRDNEFSYDEKPVRIISGAIHYFRVVPKYWEDRLTKLKACGCNTVETYIPWNLHEPQEGKFCFEGMADVERFIKTAAQLGLFVIVRPSPYICAEWEFGGLPYWLLKEPDMRLRCSYKPYLDKVDAYFDVLIPKLKPLLCTNGGPIIAVQIENEYGSYGNDSIYLEYLKNALINRGIDVLLFTSDGPADHMLQGGTLPDVYKTVNFGSRPQEAFNKLLEYQQDKPPMCAEFWNGWFDHWGDEHKTRSAKDAADVLDKILQVGGSVNFYMFHGGTNFGFYNGANFTDKYEPTITSYDYDCLLTEAGDPTEKYYEARKVISKYVDLDMNYKPAISKKKAYGEIQLLEQAELLSSLDIISSPVKSVCPEPMEKLGQDYGFILYTTNVTGPKKNCLVNLLDVHDRALIFLNDKYKGVIERNGDEKVYVDIPSEGAKLSILVENMGRINYGPKLKDMKGITEGVRLDYQFIFNWDIYTLPMTMTSLSNLKYSNIKETSCIKQSEGPIFYRGTIEINEPNDTFLELKGWTKGIVLINGFNLGRYWNIGPQKTLYVPGPILHKGKNEVIVFELHRTEKLVINFRDTPDIF